MDEEELYRLKAYLDRSKNRRKILEILKKENQPMKPTEISKKIEVHRTTVSKRLADLKEEELVKVLNPEDNRNRYYKITQKGEKLLSKK